MAYVALLPIKHTSERLPGKNFREFLGKPLFIHILSTLHDVPQVSKVVINTDSDLILNQDWSRFTKVECIRRPRHLVGSDIPMVDIIRHDVEHFAADWYLQTHATNPLLTAATISGALEELETPGNPYDSLVSVDRIQSRLYSEDFEAINHQIGRLERTQDLRPIYRKLLPVRLQPWAGAAWPQARGTPSALRHGPARIGRH